MNYLRKKVSKMTYLVTKYGKSGREILGEHKNFISAESQFNSIDEGDVFIEISN